MKALTRSAALLGAFVSVVAATDAQAVRDRIRIAQCRPQTAIEFIAPMPTEQVPIFHGASPTPESWHVVLEISTEPATRSFARAARRSPARPSTSTSALAASRDASA